MANCAFCDLLSQGKLNLYYEDEKVVAFPDIEPKASTHILIIPREHIPSINAITEDQETLLGHLFTIAKQLAKEQGIAHTGYRTVINTGSDAGQTVHHFHLHLMGGQPLGSMNSDSTHH